PGGCTSWCAYSSTVGAPGGPGLRPSTAGRLSPAVTTSTSGSPASRSSPAVVAALAQTFRAASGSADTDGIRTSRSRSARADGRISRTALPMSAVMVRTLPSRLLGEQVQVGGEAAGHLHGPVQVGVADDDHAVGDQGGPPVPPRRAHREQVECG